MVQLIPFAITCPIYFYQVSDICKTLSTKILYEPLFSAVQKSEVFFQFSKMFINPSQDENLAGWARIFFSKLMATPIDYTLFSKVLAKSCSIIQYRIWPEINNKTCQ